MSPTTTPRPGWLCRQRGWRSFRWSGDSPAGNGDSSQSNSLVDYWLMSTGFVVVYTYPKKDRNAIVHHFCGILLFYFLGDCYAGIMMHMTAMEIIGDYNISEWLAEGMLQNMGITMIHQWESVGSKKAWHKGLDHGSLRMMHVSRQFTMIFKRWRMWTEKVYDNEFDG